MTRITIGVTVNLQNYENLKVEVEGEDGEHLLGVLDNILGSLGRNDDHARTAIDSYRRRVLGVTETPEVKKTAPYVRKAERGDPNKCGKCGRSSSDVPQPKIAFIGGIYQCVECYKAGKDLQATPSPVAAPPLHAPSSIPDGAGHPAGTVTCTSPPPEAPAAASPKAVAEPPAKVPKPGPVDATCEVCGANLSAAEEKTSRLFFQKKLCRQCLTSANADEANA